MIMRRFISIITLATMSVFAVCAKTPALNGIQTDGNDKTKKSQYLTGPWYDNWVLSAGGGVQTMISGYANDSNRGFDTGTSVLTPSFDFSLAKWITPSVAVRFGIQGFNLTENRKFTAIDGWNHYVPKYDDERIYYGQTYMHADILWNITNHFWGYKAKRVYNFVPYMHSGYLRLCHPDEGIFTKEYRDREIEMGFGLLNTFRISDHFGLNLDLRWGNFAGRFHDVSNGGRVNDFSATVGVSYTFLNSGWSRNSERYMASADLESSIEALRKAEDARLALVTKELEEARRQIESDREELSRLACESQKKDNPRDMGDELLMRIATADLVLFYPINSDILSSQESYRLDSYIKDVLAHDPEHIFYITGSADKGTGTEKINTRLSVNRAENIKKILMDKYGVAEEQIVVKGTIITDRHADGSLDRCTLFESR